MIKNYFKIAWRNIMKHKMFSFINVIGFTIGLSTSFIIGLMIYHEYTFDNFHEGGDRIFRIVTDYEDPDATFHNSGINLALKDAIADDSNFENIAEFYVEVPSKVENKEENITFNWPQFVIYTHPEYFEILNYNFLAGNKNVLTNPNTVVLTKTRAADYFPRLSPNEIIGKTLVYNDSINITVGGIVENFKRRSDFVFQEFVSHPTILQTRLRNQFLEKSWTSTNSASQILIKLKEIADLNAVQEKLNDIAITHTSEEAKKRGSKRTFNLQPIKDIHFNNDYNLYDWTKTPASKPLLRNLALVAIFLLLLGCVNFINLNTAQASQRAKEIGIRKTLGSSRKQLISQFMGETFLLVLFSAGLSLLLSKGLLHIFSDFVPEGLGFELFKVPQIIISGIILLLFVTLLSGFYPAMVLSNFNTVSILKNHLTIRNKKTRLRKYLTVFQFTIAQIFIIGTLLVSKQINYLLTKDMGFKTEAIVSVYSPRGEGELSKKELYVEKLKAIPEIKSISLGGQPPASNSTSTSIVAHLSEGKQVNTTLHYIYGDTDYYEVFELELLAGRMYRNDTIKELVINEKYSRILGYENPEDAIGKTVYDNNGKLSIVGVMADFHQRSLKDDIEPMVLVGDWYRASFGFSQFQAVHISFHNEDAQSLKTTLSKIEEAYASIYTEIDDYRVEFMDENIASFYSREKKISKLLNWATGLSILISCLGLLGLVIYTTNRRVKEIGVRKVLGASLLQINTLLCKEFLTLVVIAFVIAVPIAWYGVYSWLQDFVYKADISFWMFLIGGCTMIFFALLVISAKTVQAANANPVRSLRSE